MHKVISILLLTTTLFQARLQADGPASKRELSDYQTKQLKNIDTQVNLALDEGQFAGCVVAIGNHEGIAYLKAFGNRQIEPTPLPMQTNTLFDLASLTKPIATATSVMQLVEQGKIRLNDPLSKHLKDLSGEGTNKITIEQLLTHQAGYIPDNSIEDYQHGIEEAWQRLLALRPENEPGTKFVYSDVGFELLGLLIERISGQKQNEYVKQNIFAPLDMQNTGYLPNKELRKNVAVTEQREGRWMVGEVHDPRAYKLGGVAGHAGLFSTAEDLSRYAMAMLQSGELKGKRILSPYAIQEMIRPRKIDTSWRTAGWDSLSGYSSNRGELMSHQAFGHGGFTGTGIWIDPTRDLFVIFLSNRLHPDGKGNVNPLIGRIGSIAVASCLSE